MDTTTQHNYMTFLFSLTGYDGTLLVQQIYKKYTTFLNHQGGLLQSW